MEKKIAEGEITVMSIYHSTMFTISEILKSCNNNDVLNRFKIMAESDQDLINESVVRAG